MEIPAEIEAYRDKLWRREEVLKLKDPSSAEAFVESVGFCLALTDVRTPMPSIYIAICGRRDAYVPTNMQKDPEASAAWLMKDDLMRRGKVYYSKLLKGKATFVSKELVSYFHAVFGVPQEEEAATLSVEAQKILEVLRVEWESSTADLRAETGIEDRRQLTKALDELQRCMKVMPYEVLYEPKFTYLWALAEERFPKELAAEVSREEAVYRIAEVFLTTLGLTLKGELSKATGIPRKEAGAANHRLVDEGVAERLAPGVYKLRNLPT